MKKYLTEKNIMWAAIAVLALMSFNQHSSSNRFERMNRGMVERMRSMPKGLMKGEMGVEQKRGRGNGKNRGNSKQEEK